MNVPLPPRRRARAGRAFARRAGSLALAMAATPATFAATGYVSLSPYESSINFGAVLRDGGSGGPLVVPPTSTPGINWGFVVPADYKTGKLKLVLLWEAPGASGCTLHLRTNILMRARNGAYRDDGGSAGGLSGLEASTPFTADDTGISMAAPDPAGSVESVAFQISGNGEFPGPFKPGDAIVAGIFRFGDSPLDTCDADFVIDGAHVEYETAAP